MENENLNPPALKIELNIIPHGSIFLFPHINRKGEIENVDEDLIIEIENRLVQVNKSTISLLMKVQKQLNQLVNIQEQQLANIEKLASVARKPRSWTPLEESLLIKLEEQDLIKNKSIAQLNPDQHFDLKMISLLLKRGGTASQKYYADCIKKPLSLDKQSVTALMVTKAFEKRLKVTSGDTYPAIIRETKQKLSIFAEDSTIAETHKQALVRVLESEIIVLTDIKEMAARLLENNFTPRECGLILGTDQAALPNTLVQNTKHQTISAISLPSYNPV